MSHCSETLKTPRTRPEGEQRQRESQALDQARQTTAPQTEAQPRTAWSSRARQARPSSAFKTRSQCGKTMQWGPHHFAQGPGQVSLKQCKSTPTCPGTLSSGSLPCVPLRRKDYGAGNGTLNQSLGLGHCQISPTICHISLRILKMKVVKSYPCQDMCFLKKEHTAPC